MTLISRASSVRLWLCVVLLCTLSWTPGLISQLAPAPAFPCREAQRAVLLDFYNHSGFDWLDNLWPDSDRDNHTLCACQWFGVQCDQQGFIVSLHLYDPINIGGAFPLNSSRPSSLPWPLLFAKLGSLKELRMEGFYHDQPLPEEIGHLPPSLTTLSLSQCKILPPLPATALSNLSKLTYLDLSYQGLDMEPIGKTWPMYFSGFQIPQQLCNIATLQYLDLAGNGFGSGIPSCIGLLPHLSHLSLSYNNLEGPIPEQMWHSTSNLTYLDLSSNFLSGQISPRISNAEMMSSLNLKLNNLTGGIPESVGELLELTSLHLAFNSLTGSIPAGVGNLTRLGILDLSHNMLSGVIPHQLGNLVNLADRRQLTEGNSLDLSGNQLSGRVPPSLGKIGANASRHFDVDLSSNNLIGNLPWALLTSGGIYSLYVHSNHLAGIADYGISSSVPGFSVNTSSLTLLDASANDFTGAIFAWLECLSGLRYLDLSINHLESSSFPNSGSPNWTLFELSLSSNNMQGPIPAWLSLQTSLDSLDLSFNQLEGTIPAWFWSLRVSARIDISMNKLRGDIRLDAVCAESYGLFNGSHNFFTKIQTPFNGSSQDYNGCSGVILDLHSNQLSGLLPWHTGSNFTSSVFWESLNLADNSFFGSLPEFPPSTDLGGNFAELDLSQNQLSGRIPASISNLGLQSLRLSFNNFSGEIPSSLCSFGQLHVLKLDSNLLSGSIPHELGLCSDQLASLVLKDNLLTGSLPQELSNLTQSLVVLDVSHNSLQGGIPPWLQQMQSLRVLILGHNAFSGELPASRWNTTQLQVLDLSSNRLRGSIPSRSLSLLPTGFIYINATRNQLASNTLYDESITIQAKGQALTATLVSLDLSNNEFVGPIPAELGDLDGMVFLNLSHNRLSGSIPESLGQLRQLNSLDLSSNELEGELPTEALCELTLLGFVNLAGNRLRGPIPRCNQWSTFPAQSFAGNEGLCGPPLLQKCSSAAAPPTS